jgi:uncharacterized protein involved in exopolysaccharide biosynthesis
MRMPALAALLLLIATPGWLPAQEAGKTKPDATQEQDPETEFNSLKRDFIRAVNAWREERQQKAAELQKLAEEGKPVPAMEMTPAPTKEFITRAQELAEKYEGKDDAVPFLSFILKNASSERNAAKKAFKTLVADHQKSEKLEDVVPFFNIAAGLVGQDDTLAALDTILGENKHKTVLAQAYLARGSMRLDAAKTDDERKAATDDLKKVAEFTTDEDLLANVKARMFEIEHLQIGCEAPEIDAKDVDGVGFKLSDYRGKVVLLDFWGFW